jgi:ketosteroid isomerase-like protein
MEDLTMSEQVIHEIEATDDARYQAMMALDLAALERILGDDLLYTHGSAATDTKREYIDALKSGKYKYRSAKKAGVTVRVYGDVAIMHGQVTIEAEVGGSPRTLNNVFVNVWVKRSGRWQLVHWASTPIPK